MTKLTLDQADRIAKAGISFARSNGLNRMGIAIIDAGGNLVLGLREDQSGLAAIEIATGKARAALTFGCTSAQIADALSGNPLAGPSVLSILQGRIVLLGGAVLLKDDDGETIGAVGGAGGAPADDEKVAAAGAAAMV